MEAGVDGRTIADKIANPNRPTWESYKKENEDKVCITLRLVLSLSIGFNTHKISKFR